MRYYQSLMDLDAILKGEDYKNLKESYVIFICMFDPFSEGLPVYFFENICRQKKSCTLSDKAYKVCYNVNAFAEEDNARLKAILEYLKTQQATDNFTMKLDELVANAKMDDEARRDFMLRSAVLDDYYDRGKEEGYSLGVEDGIEQGFKQGSLKTRLETAFNFLSLGIATKEQIASATGLPLSEVEQLSSNL